MRYFFCSVKSYLAGQGISPSRMTAVGKGEEEPLKPNTTREGRRANRRVEIELVAE
jgi:outer membrane protein OmpA-like peptidoglycan-associated protein